MTAEEEKQWFNRNMVRTTIHGALTPELALRLGQAAGIESPRSNPEKLSVVLGKDQRRVNYMLETTLAGGFMSVGAQVELTGPIPTSAVAMLTHSMRADLGVMITGGDRPYMESGIKLFDRHGWPIPDTLWERIKERASTDMSPLLATGEASGYAHRTENAPHRYSEFLKRSAPKDLDLSGLRVVLDCANGASCVVAPMVLQELGAGVVPMNVSPNGTNINYLSGPDSPKALVQMVRERRADLGCALDGEGSRVLFVDERGNVLNTDEVMVLLAIFGQQTGRPPEGGIVSDWRSPLLVHELGRRKIPLGNSRKGERYLLAAAKRFNGGAWITCNKEGRITFPDILATSDALLAVLHIMAIRAAVQEPLSQIVSKSLK